MDHDNNIGFWIDQEPYVWVPHDDYKMCARLYYRHTPPLSSDCGWAQRYFFPYKGEKGEVRVNGKKIDTNDDVFLHIRHVRPHVVFPDWLYQQPHIDAWVLMTQESVPVGFSYSENAMKKISQTISDPTSISHALIEQYNMQDGIAVKSSPIEILTEGRVESSTLKHGISNTSQIPCLDWWVGKVNRKVINKVGRYMSNRLHRIQFMRSLEVPEYREQYFQYIRQNPPPPSFDRSRAKHRLRGIVGLLPKSVANYLDVGCGDGSITTAIHQHYKGRAKTSCTEVGEIPADFPKELIRYKASDTLPIENSSVDLVTMFMVLHHLEDKLDVVLQQIQKVCKPGAILIIRDHDMDPAKLQGESEEIVRSYLDWIHVYYALLEKGQFVQVDYRKADDWAHVLRRYGFESQIRIDNNDSQYSYYESFVKV